MYKTFLYRIFQIKHKFDQLQFCSTNTRISFHVVVIVVISWFKIWWKIFNLWYGCNMNIGRILWRESQILNLVSIFFFQPKDQYLLCINFEFNASSINLWCFGCPFDILNNFYSKKLLWIFGPDIVWLRFVLILFTLLFSLEVNLISQLISVHFTNDMQATRYIM